MQQNNFVVRTKHFAISIKFWLLKQNVLSGQQKKFCCINFFLSVPRRKQQKHKRLDIIILLKN